VQRRAIRLKQSTNDPCFLQTFDRRRSCAAAASHGAPFCLAGLRLRSELTLPQKSTSSRIDLYYSPYRNVSRKNIKGFDQIPLGRFFLEDATKD